MMQNSRRNLLCQRERERAREREREREGLCTIPKLASVGTACVDESGVLSVVRAVAGRWKSIRWPWLPTNLQLQLSAGTKTYGYPRVQITTSSCMLNVHRDPFQKHHRTLVHRGHTHAEATLCFRIAGGTCCAREKERGDKFGKPRIATPCDMTLTMYVSTWQANHFNMHIKSAS